MMPRRTFPCPPWRGSSGCERRGQDAGPAREVRCVSPASPYALSARPSPGSCRPRSTFDTRLAPWSVPPQRDTLSTLQGNCAPCASAVRVRVEHGWQGGHRARLPRRQGWSPRRLSQWGECVQRCDAGMRAEHRRPGPCPSPARRLRAPPRAPALSPHSDRALCGPAPAAPGHAAHSRPSPGGGRWPGAPPQAGAPAAPQP